MDKEGFDLVHLCSTFASDPFVMAFAKLIESGARLPCQLDLEIHPCLHVPSLGSARRLNLLPTRAALVLKIRFCSLSWHSGYCCHRHIDRNGDSCHCCHIAQ